VEQLLVDLILDQRIHGRIHQVPHTEHTDACINRGAVEERRVEGSWASHLYQGTIAADPFVFVVCVMVDRLRATWS
jgi:hypothetical protein